VIRADISRQARGRKLAQVTLPDRQATGNAPASSPKTLLRGFLAGVT